MSENQTTAAVATTPKEQRTPVGIGYRGLEVKTLEDLWRVSGYIAKSGLAPKGIETPEAIFTALELGLELGLPPMAALQNIAVINGRPGVFGDVALALVRASGLLEDYAEHEVGKPNTDEWGFQCICKRAGCKFANSTFTVADAKRAQLWGKPGPWTQYPKRMLKFRARGYLLRDEFGDVLKGVKTVEELRDLDEEERFQRAKPVNGPPPPALKQPSAPPPPPAAAGPTTPDNAQPAGRGTQPAASPAADEATESTMGLAPERAAEESGPALSDTQRQLEVIITGADATFDEFKKWGAAQFASGDSTTGVLAWDAMGGFGDVPEKAAKLFVRAKTGMINGIKQMKGVLV